MTGEYGLMYKEGWCNWVLVLPAKHKVRMVNDPLSAMHSWVSWKSAQAA